MAQTKDIDDTRQLRDEASALRAQAVRGRYDNNDFAKYLGLLLRSSHVLQTSNPQLGERAGLGKSFFSSAVRDRRRPKLNNMLGALTAIIDTANERLQDIDEQNPRDGAGIEQASVSQETRFEDLRLLAASLAQLGREEIERMDSARPNEPKAFEEYQKQRDLIAIFVGGFDRIAKELYKLNSLPANNDTRSQAQAVVTEVGEAVACWWKENALNVVDWTTKISFMTAGIAFLRIAGANMDIATPAIAALVGGEKIMQAVMRRSGRKRRT